jgi:hypothetical protein
VIFYDQATCLLAELPPDTLWLCPGDGAMLALQLIMLALMVVFAVHIVEGSLASYRELRRLERLRRVTGRVGDGDKEEWTPNSLW